VAAARCARGEPVARRLAHARARRDRHGSGSSIYHWDPSNNSLAGDRLPIAWACAALAARLPRRTRRDALEPARMLAAALAVATLSVAFWWLTERAGQGDLRLYLFVQMLPMVLVPLGLGLRLAPTTPTATPASAWWGVLAATRRPSSSSSPTSRSTPRSAAERAHPEAPLRRGGRGLAARRRGGGADARGQLR
jgi:hypothetical protein